MRIALVIPAHHRPHGLWALLSRLRHLGVTAHVVVLVDGRDATVEKLARFFGVASILQEKALGAGAARNLGALSCPADWYVFLDDDVLPQPGWWEKLTDTLARTRADMLSGAVVYGGRRQYPERVVENPRAAFPMSAHLVVRGAVFHALGGFDPTWSALHNEDLEFALRLLQEGFRWESRPDLVVMHQASWWPAPSSLLAAARYAGEVPRLRAHYGPLVHALPIPRLGPFYFPKELFLLLFFPLVLPPLFLRFCFLHRAQLPRALPYFLAKWPASLLLRRWYLWKSAWIHRIFCV